MNRSIQDAAEWNDSHEVRPLKGDFDPYGGCLDALSAWKDLGGLSRTEAFEKFCKLPESYQEHFMFMGGAAFAFYYPVLERYVLESNVEKNDGNDVEAMWILPYCIKAQFDANNVSVHLRQRIRRLVTHVRANLKQYCADVDEQGKIDTAWSELERELHGG